jgi:hypothetical protein
MIDIISLSKDEFIRYKKSYTDEKIKSVLQQIVVTHECFNQNYKYVPLNDENYQQKLYNYQKKTKKLFDIEVNEKQVYALFNKISKSNYTKIKDKIITTLKNAKIDYMVFINKLLKYTESSQLYTDLICDIIYDTKAKNPTFYEVLTTSVFDTYITEYMNKYTSSKNIEFLSNFDYEDYDQFCLYNKNVNKGFNMLHTIITLANAINYDIETIVKNIYSLHVDNMKTLFDTEYTYKHVLMYQLFTHIEYLLKNKNASSYIDNTEDFILMSSQIQKNINNNKLKFKIQDITDYLDKLDVQTD